MPSITFWNRLEPRPRTRDIRESLRARVRDPLWILARQWQMGEFQAEDAGTAAHVDIATASGSISGFMPSRCHSEIERPVVAMTSSARVMRELSFGISRFAVASST